MRWIDISRKGEPEFVMNGISIHSYLGQGDQWFASSDDLGITNYNLNTNDLEVAKQRAIKLAIEESIKKLDEVQLIRNRFAEMEVA